MTKPHLRATPRRRVVNRAGRVGAWLLLVVLNLALLTGISALFLTDRTLTLPDVVTRQVEARLNARLTRGAIELGQIAIFIDRGGVPRISLLDVALNDSDGSGVMRLDRVQAVFNPIALFDGRVVPRRVTLAGAQITLRRAVDGSFLLSFGQGESQFPGLSGVLDEMDALLSQGPYAEIEKIEVEDLTVSIEDARSARVWTIADGRLSLEQKPDTIDITLAAEVLNGTDQMARAQLSIRSFRADGRAAITANVTNAAARDIALQSPALAVLGVLDAPISGALRTTLDQSGRVEELAGTLEIGAGVVQPRRETTPLAFDSAKAYFAFRPADQKITFSQIEVESPDLSAEISGHAYLRELSEQGVPRALVTQLRLDRLRIAPLGLFADTLTFDQGAADVRLRLDPLSIEIGQAVLSEPDGAGGLRSYRARGRMAAEPGGWDVAVDLEVPEVPVARALELWPVPLAAGTRKWMETNIAGGTLHGVTAALRSVGGGPGDLAATFSFRDAGVTFLRDMPPVTGSAGYAALVDRRFVLTVEKGLVTPDQGGPIDLAGTVLVVPDTKVKPARGQFTLIGDGTLTGILSLLSNPPLNLLKDNPRGPDLARAQAGFAATLEMPLQKGLKPPDISWSATGQLRDVASDILVPGRSVSAADLLVTADRGAVTVVGTAALDGVPIEARWRMGLTPDERGKSQLRGQVELSANTVERLGIGLPKGTLSGKGSGDFVVDLAAGAAPRLTLDSTLAGVGLSLPALDWAKPAGGTGTLSLSATLGAVPKVERLALSAAGLEASGSISIARGGGLDRATFDRVRLNGWLDTPVTLIGAGRGRPPEVRIGGGSLDFRRATFGKGSGGTGAAHGPIAIALDRLVVTEGVALTNFTGQLAAGRVTGGSFTARVNGGTPVRGDLAGGARGVSLKLIANDAGGVLRDAGLVKTGYDGPMEVVLVPTGARGTYDGSLRVGRFRLRGAPAIADLLGAISVVGLLEQLNGDGLVFDETEANFRLTPAQLVLYKASAVGASLGISLDGVYDLGSKRVDMQGVISPIYLLNRIGSIFTRRGEGLFGFNFRLTGAAAKPDVSVNPLSILTPGMFREIFRRPAPTRGN